MILGDLIGNSFNFLQQKLWITKQLEIQELPKQSCQELQENQE